MKGGGEKESPKSGGDFLQDLCEINQSSCVFCETLPEACHSPRAGWRVFEDLDGHREFVILSFMKNKSLRLHQAGCHGEQALVYLSDFLVKYFPLDLLL